LPEGDSIRRDAQTLAPLVGQTITRVTTQGLERDLEGRAVSAVTPYGKHLTISLDDETDIRVHRGIRGRFRVLAEPPRISPGRASLVIETADAVYAWLDAREVEIAPRRAAFRGRAVASLGPDVLADAFDSRQAASRARLHATRKICDVVLDQHVVAGIGNIYKNEALFLCGVDPRTLVTALSDDQLAAIYTRANELMRVRSRDYFAYGRTGEPCRQCGALIEIASLGDPPRWTWTCPQCQAPGAFR
jgi:endonuclease-8